MNAMNAILEWIGSSAARRHIYFYLALIATSVFANSVKDSLLGQNVLDSKATKQLEEMRQQIESAPDPFASLQ